MTGFQNIIGHEDVVQHLENAVKTGKISHAYIFSGENGSGKKTLAYTFAMALQCQSEQDRPCMKCESCKRAAGKNHPDIITVNHEKAGTISVEEIRTQLVNDVDIRPFYGPRKIYLIPDAQMMTQQAQNAILKTIEEPPEYAVILLLTSNVDFLLPTIRSRCVRLDLKLVEDSLIKEYLMKHLHVPDYKADLDVSYARGSIGRAEQAAESEEFAAMTENAMKLLKTLHRMDAAELAETVKELSSDKEQIEEYLDIFQFWFRDVLMFKATREADKCVFKHELNSIREQAKEYSYENLEQILESIERTRIRIRANVNLELALDLLFRKIRETD